MNSNSLLTTVFKNFQCAFRKRGYWPTIYIMSDATTALLSLPRLISQRPKRSLMTVTKNRFSVSSSTNLSQNIKLQEKNSQENNVLIAPDIEPIAQHSVLRLFHDHSEPSTCFASFSVIIASVSATSRCVRNTSNSLIDLYSTMVSLSFMNSRTISPSSFSTIST